MLAVARRHLTAVMARLQNFSARINSYLLVVVTVFALQSPKFLQILLLQFQLLDDLDAIVEN